MAIIYFFRCFSKLANIERREFGSYSSLPSFLRTVRTSSHQTVVELKWWNLLYFLRFLFTCIILGIPVKVQHSAVFFVFLIFYKLVNRNLNKSWRSRHSRNCCQQRATAKAGKLDTTFVTSEKNRISAMIGYTIFFTREKHRMTNHNSGKKPDTNFIS